MKQSNFIHFPLRILIIVVISNISVAFSQNRQYFNDENIRFTNYLVKHEFYDDAIFLLKQLDSPNDSVLNDYNYLMGWSLYNKKKLEESSLFLQKVKCDSDHYFKSHFFFSYNHIYKKQYVKSVSCLDSLKINKDLYSELKSFQLAGVALLNNDIKSYKTHSSNFKYKSYLLSNQEHKFDEFSGEIENFNRKSPWIAGLLSAIFPGAGKVYAEKYGGAVSAMLTTGVFGAMTYENYRKAGISNYKTIIFGSLFSLFYIGNIYGSVYAVKDYRNDFKNKMEYRIMFHLHIPLRNTFN